MPRRFAWIRARRCFLLSSRPVMKLPVSLLAAVATSSLQDASIFTNYSALMRSIYALHDLGSIEQLCTRCLMSRSWHALGYKLSAAIRLRQMLASLLARFTDALYVNPLLAIPAARSDPGFRSQCGCIRPQCYPDLTSFGAALPAS